MSTTGQVVGGITGAAVGFVVGGPTGAIYGAQIGMSVGGLLDPPKGPTVEGPRLGDLSVQTSTYGQFIPRTYGTIGLSGNVFWLENNQLKEVVRKKKSGGKGGGSSSTVKTYTYFATFAVGLCEGPIAGVRRIWAGPDLIYDAGSDDLDTIIASNQAAEKFSIYLGTDTQQPDARMQAEMGVANCPAYRGLAYIVMKDLALANYGNSVAGAQVKVETVKIPTFKTNTLLDISPAAETDLTSDSGAAFKSDFSGMFYLSKRELLSAQVSELSFGTSSVIGSYATEYNDAGQPARGLVSYDGDMWLGIKTNNSLPTNLFRRTKDSFFFYIESDVLVRGVRRMNDTNDNVFIYLYTGGGAGTSGTMRNVGYSLASIDGGILNYGMTVTPGYRINTAGDELHEFQASGNTISVRTYTDLCVFVSSYSVTVPGDALSTVSSEFGALGLGTQSFMLSGVFYLCEKVTTGFRVVSCTSSGVVDDYVVVATDGFGDLYGFYMTTESTGYIVDGDRFVQFSRYIEADQTLSDIVSSEMLKSSLIKSGDIEVSSLTQKITGFKVTSTGSIRNAIEPLRGAWPFDVVQAGYKIKATPRGSASVATIPVGDLAIDTQLNESREMDSQLPQNVTVKYIDRSRDYDANEQRAQRDNTEAVNSLVLELPVVLSSNQSAQVAEKLIRIYALEKSDFSFTLPPPYRYLEPGDVVTITTDDADYILRLVSVNQTADGRMECAGRPSSASTYTSIAPGDGGQTGGTTIPLPGSTTSIFVDCPVIDEGLQNAPGFALGMNGDKSGWPGGILYRTSDGGQTWDDLQAINGRATAGLAVGVLSASAGNLIQRGGSLTVSMISGTLESVTEAQMLNGANIVAYGINGRWEIMRFQNATLNGDGTYTLDTFWRGDKGTEWATGLHSASDYVVLMTDPDLAFVGLPADIIGQPRDYRSITAGADIDSAASVSFTYDATNLETLSGVHPSGSRSAGDLTVTWQRRTRVGGAWRDYVDASLGESTQAYEVDVMDGSTVKRTLSAVTPTVLYTDAMQVSDFGSTQSSVTVNIYQLSAVVGRGYKLEATL